MELAGKRWMLLMASNKSDPTNGDSRSSIEIHARQTEALERLVDLFDPKRKPRKRFALRMVGYVFAGVSAAMGLREVVRIGYESYLRRETISNWVEAARETYVVEGDSTSALELLKKADEFDPQNPDVIKLRAYIDGMQTVEHLINLGDQPFTKKDVEDYGRAQSEAIMLQNVQPNDPYWAILRGQLALVVNEPERAKEFLEKALQLEPKNDFAILRMALVHRQLAKKPIGANKESEWSMCTKLLDESLVLNPNSKFAMVWQGIIQMQKNEPPKKEDLENAKKWFQKAINVDSRYSLAWQSLGEANQALAESSGENLEAKKAFLEAKNAYLRTLEIRPDYVNALNGLANVYGAEDEYEIGFRYASMATDSDPKNVDGWILRGRIATELAKKYKIRKDTLHTAQYVKESIDAYSEALNLNPRNGEAYLERSAMYLQSEQFLECKDDVENAFVYLKDTNANVWSCKANYFAAINLHNEVVQCCGEALSRDPELETTYILRAKSRNALGDKIGAAKDYDLALEHAKTNFKADICIARGLFQFDNGNLDAALIEFKTATVANPNSFEAWIGEARTHLRLNRLEDLKTSSRNAYALNPTDDEVKQLFNGSPSTVGGAPSAASTPVKSKNP